MYSRGERTLASFGVRKPHPHGLGESTDGDGEDGDLKVAGDGLESSLGQASETSWRPFGIFLLIHRRAIEISKGAVSSDGFEIKP